MLNNKDQESLANAVYAASLLRQNLDSLSKATDPLLTGVAQEFFHQSTQIEQHLRRLSDTCL